MLNMDMVGRLRDNKLIVHGTGTAAEFDLLIERLNAGHNFKIIKKNRVGTVRATTHHFMKKKIPALHFFTGAHQDYHRPEDDYEKINVEGIERVSRMVADAALAIAETAARPAYQKTKRPKVAGGKMALLRQSTRLWLRKNGRSLERCGTGKSCRTGRTARRRCDGAVR